MHYDDDLIVGYISRMATIIENMSRPLIEMFGRTEFGIDSGTTHDMMALLGAFFLTLHIEVRPKFKCSPNISAEPKIGSLHYSKMGGGFHELAP